MHHYKKYYSSDNAFIVVVGDVKAEEMIEKIRASFGQVRGSSPQKVPATREPEQRGEKRLSLKKEAELPYVAVAYHTPSFPHEDSYGLEVLGAILSGGKSSRIYQTLVYERNLALNAGADYSGMNLDPFLFFAWGTASPGREIRDVGEALYGEIEKIKELPPTDKEIQKAKNQIEASFIFDQDSLYMQARKIGTFELLGGFVIGGGIAGLTAALTLADAGVPATIYDAAQRTGGRILTDRPGRPGCGLCHEVKSNPGFYWDDGQYSDPFGELIDSIHPTMLSLASRFNLPLIDLFAAQPAGSTDTYYFLGQHYSKAQADADFAVLYPTLRADLRAAGYPTTYNRSTRAGRLLDSMSIYQWIESRVPGGHNSPLGRLLDAAYAIEYGADTTDQSALNLIYLLAYNNPKRLSIYGESDERYRIAGGADLLPMAIAEYLGLERVVKLGWQLEALAQSSDGSYLLSFDGRREIRADHVILAFPFAVLRYLDYSRAGFDPLKIKAIQELGAGKNGKMHLQFTNRYWNQRGDWGLSNGSRYADTGYQCTWDASRGQRGASGLLVNYTGGSVAASMRLKHPYGDSLNNSRVIADAANFLMQIEPVFPGISAAWNGKADGSMAHLNPLWNSSYAYWRAPRSLSLSYHDLRAN